MGNKEQNSYMVQLDSLRFFAITLVTIEHWLYTSFLNKIMPTGFLGVRLFFVLSGFLITLIILKGKQKANLNLHYKKRDFLKSFYIRRFLRIFPIYYLSLAVLFIINFSTVRELIGWHLTYTSNIFYFINQGLYGIETHFWTLASEEQFYLIWPLLLLITPRKHILKVILFFIGVGVFSRIILLYSGFNYILTVPFTTFDSFGIGGIIAYVFLNRKDHVDLFLSWRRNLLWGINLFIFIIVLLIPLPYDRTNFLYKILLSATSSVFFAWLIMKAAVGFKTGLIKKILEFRPIVYIGKISYGFYIFHVFVQYAFSKVVLVLPENMFRYVLFYAATVMLATISWFFFEKPINNLKNRFQY